MKNLLAIIFIVSLLAAAGYFAYTAVKAPVEMPPGSSLSFFSGQTAAPAPAPAPKSESASKPVLEKRQLPAGAKEYLNRAYGFSLFYPSELLVTEQAEGASGRAVTITFQNVETVQGLQIFIMPYGEAQVSEERFRMDVPSGVRKNLSEAKVDGAVGASFYSENTELGETYETWFIHNGFLYEITTLKPLDNWLKEILETWKWGR